MSKPQSVLDEVVEHGQLESAGASPASPPSRRAFISAPASVDTSVLRRALESRGVVPYEIDDLAEAGVSIPELLDDCVRRADLVVAVIDPGLSGDHVLFELGYATALKKRVLALVPPDQDPPVSEIPYLRASADNKEAIEFGLDQVLNAPWAGWQPPKDQIHKTTPIGERADVLLGSLKAALEHPDEQELTELVLDALAASGISSLSDSSVIRAENGRTDFAIWSDDFEPWVGNPLLIEVRSRLTRAADLDRAIEQLTAMLERTHTAWGLLLYGVADFQPGAEAARRSRVFVMSIEDFVEALKGTGLGDLLSRRRNLRVHGRGQDGRLLPGTDQEATERGG